jgi:hypothetical protein
MRLDIADKMATNRANDFNVSEMFTHTFDDDTIKKDFMNTLMHITKPKETLDGV